MGRVGWLIWIDACVNGRYLDTPDDWNTIVISGEYCAPDRRDGLRMHWC